MTTAAATLTSAQPAGSQRLARFRMLLLPLMVPMVYALACWPTRASRPFGDEMELLNVATAMELRWLDNWSLPSLQGETRMMKPPLSAWLTASIIPSEVLEQLRSPETNARKAAQG